jgi:prepilin-type N-terminal cleavage/methylation domain-containing protein
MPSSIIPPSTAPILGGGKRMNRKGFTLIELAIVLVIIGIILGAVLKGQDLIRNARAKKLIVQTTKWEAFTWSFMDQKGRFPGDEKNNGIIGDQSGETGSGNSAIDEIDNENYTNPPKKTITLGSSTFYVKMGNDGNGTTPHDLIALCASNDCSGTFDDDAIKYAEFVDTSIDGEANAQNGLVRGAGTITLNGDGDTITAATPDSSDDYSSSDKAIIYFFDKKP